MSKIEKFSQEEIKDFQEKFEFFKITCSKHNNLKELNRFIKLSNSLEKNQFLTDFQIESMITHAIKFREYYSDFFNQNNKDYFNQNNKTT